MDYTTIPPDLKTIVHGKWILLGEHAVLRGHPAIIFPVKCRSLTLEYWQTKEEAKAEFSGDFGEETQFVFWGAIERALEILALHHHDIGGRFHLTNNIPIGTGMGASAALCVAIGRWFVGQGKVRNENVLEFARQLENLFHNESSGADIAVAIAGEGILFSRSGGMHPIKPRWSPQWYLSYSDKVSPTARCVKKVKALWDTDPQLATKIDNDMAECVVQAQQALQIPEDEGLPLLAAVIKKGHDCFQRWKLTEGNVERHIQRLLGAGALAAKPTGSGNGGYILSLWDKKPPEDLGFEMIAV